MKTRLYDPELGRFLSKDSGAVLDGSALSFNPYIYAGNNPISNIDPSGKAWWNKVVEYASKVVQAVKNVVKAVVNAYVYVNNKIRDVVNKYIIQPLANYEPVGRFAEWATANPYRLAGVSIAIGVACVGGYLGVTAAIAYVQNLGTYSSSTTTSPASNWAGGAEKLTSHLNDHGEGMSAVEYTQKAKFIIDNAERSGSYMRNLGNTSLEERIMYQAGKNITVTNTSGQLITSFSKKSATDAVIYFYKNIPTPK